MLRNVLFGALCCLVISSAGLGDVKRIKLKDGRVIVGDVVDKTASGIKVKMKLAVLSLSADEIESIEDVADPKSEYKKRLAELNEKDADAQVELGQWAMDHDMLEEARERFKAALAVKSGYEKASLLLRQVEAKLRAATTVSPPIVETVETATPSAAELQKLLIKDDDLYRIRLAEVRADERIVVDFRANVIESFVRKMAGRGDFKDEGFARKFRSTSRPDQARYMLAKLDRDDPLKDGIYVKSDPIFMRDFRTYIWRSIANSCGSVRCHGGPKGEGRFKLINIIGQSDNIDYTNFLILDSWHAKPNLKMIDRDRPELSLLLEYGLPPEQARLKHPKKAPSLYGSRDAAAYKRTLEWIRQLAGPPHPDYDIKYYPPNVIKPDQAGGSSTTKPSDGKSDFPF